MTSKTAIDVKDSMWEMATASHAHFTKYVIAMMEAIRWTEGMWREMGYLYKAAQICELMQKRADQDLQEFENIPSLMAEYGEHRRKVAVQAGMYAERFQKLHDIDMYGGIKDAT